MPPGPWLTREELYSEDFPWTIIDGRVYAIGDFIPLHPGGALIRRAIGEDASELFRAHHTSALAARVLARYEIGQLCEEGSGGSGGDGPFRRLLNERAGGLEKAPGRPVAEAIAVGMLVLFLAWAWLSYVAGWWVLDASLAWFWQRHLDAGLHASAHGDFRHSRRLQAALGGLYRVLSHRAIDYYVGSGIARGVGMPKHFWHHIYTNDPRRDPDWATMSEVAWVRRHSSSAWRPYHRWQCWYWLPVMLFVEPLLELLQVAKECLEATGALLEPPSPDAPILQRLGHAGATWAEVLVNPGYQGAAFIFQPWPQALATLLLARALARLVLFPFSEVQHYMPEHFVGEVAEEPLIDAHQEEEWAVAQLRRTANLSLGSPVARLVDFLMFHGDSHQIEHHLWPAMSFVRYRQAAHIVREACREFGVPYHEVGYWQGYAKIRQQIREHASGQGPRPPPSPGPRLCSPPRGQNEAEQPPSPGPRPAPTAAAGDEGAGGGGAPDVAPAPARGRGGRPKRRRELLAEGGLPVSRRRRSVAMSAGGPVAASRGPAEEG